MTYEKFVDKLKHDDKFLRLIIRHQFRLKSLALVSRMFGLDEDTFDKLFVEDPDFEETFADKVRGEFVKIQRVVAWPRINDALATLSTIISSEDESRSVQAASALIKAQRDLIVLSKEDDDEEDELDRIWKEVQSERERKDSKNR